MFDFLDEISPNDKELFKKCIRRLLDSTFIVKDKDEKYYQYIVRGSNRQDIAEYLNVIGYNLVVFDEHGVVMLTPDETDDENSGLKRMNFISFSTSQIKVLMTLWQTYLSKSSYESEVYVTIGEILDRLKFYGISQDLNQTSFKDTMALFKRFNLLNYSSAEFEENTKVRIFASIQFCMDVAQLKQVISDYISQEMDIDSAFSGEEVE